MDKLNNAVITLLFCGAGILVIADVDTVFKVFYLIFILSVALWFLYKNKL